jgi:transcription elongation factor GreA-like protein
VCVLELTPNTIRTFTVAPELATLFLAEMLIRSGLYKLLISMCESTLITIVAEAHKGELFTHLCFIFGGYGFSRLRKVMFVVSFFTAITFG